MLDVMPRKSNTARTQTELGFIAEVARLAGSHTKPGKALALGIGDDCALLRPPRGQVVAITTDFSLEGRHFLRTVHPPESVGHRALARGLSDLAAMGATPLAAFLSLALPPRVMQTAWPEKFLAGLLALAREHRVPLAGGDTAQSPDNNILVDIVLVGAVPERFSLLRSGARAGDKLYISGSLGGAAAELAALLQSPKKFSRLHQAASGHPHLYPQPRLTLGKSLLRRATACIDISDGLSTDLAHLCQRSSVRAVVNTAALPIAPTANLKQALHGGEDYELLFTAPVSQRIPKKIAGVDITCIGEILTKKNSAPPCQLRDAAGKLSPLAAEGYEHFA